MSHALALSKYLKSKGYISQEVAPSTIHSYFKMQDLKRFCTHFPFFFASLSLMRQLLLNQSDLVILLAQYFHFFLRQIEIGTFSLREKCPNTEFFWPVFSRIRTE